MARAAAGSARDGDLARAAAFRTAMRRFLRRTDAVAAQAGLTPQRYDLLLIVHAASREHGAVRLGELCELLQLQQTAVTELVKRTEQAGLIERRSSSDDGRVSLLRLTAEGESRLLRAFDALHEDRAALAKAFRDVDARFRAASR